MSANQPSRETGREEIRRFVERRVLPDASLWDREERTPQAVIDSLAKEGYLGSIVPEAYGGLGMDATAFGILCEEIARGSAALSSLLTVHAMVCSAVLKWGDETQKRSWLPRLAKGDVLGGFALSEPYVGSDAKSVSAEARRDGSEYVLNGSKKWVSYGQILDLYLVIAVAEEGPTAFLVESSTSGIKRTPLRGLLGFRAAMLARLDFHGCRIPPGNLLGRPGYGFSHVAATALDQGRYCVACASLGLAQACLDASLAYAGERIQFGKALREHQLIQAMVADMMTGIRAARLLCADAGRLRASGDPDSVLSASMAKYFGARTAMASALDCVQIHGANGCGDEYPAQRYLRDAKIFEIIEGSNQIQQLIISRYGFLSAPVKGVK